MADEQSARLGLPMMHAGQAQKEIVHNEALALLDMLVQGQAESAALSAPPGAPAAGRCWIVAAGASGAWAGRDGQLAGWTQGGWRFAMPVAGMRVRVADRGHGMVHDGIGWADESARSDGYYQGGERVVGARQGPIADPSGGALVDVEARLAIADMLGAMRAHGLIEAS